MQIYLSQNINCMSANKHGNNIGKRLYSKIKTIILNKNHLLNIVQIDLVSTVIV